MQISEVIQRVQSGYSKGVQSDDSRLSNRHIYNTLLTARSTLVAQQARKKQKISDWNYMILPCVELIEVPSHECPCLPEAGCTVYRTKHKLPRPLTDLNNHLIAWVMTIENSIKIDEVTRDEYLYQKGNKYTSTKIKYLFEGGHAYFYAKRVPNAVKMKLLPEDPQEVYDYPSICGGCTDCDECISILDRDFPIDADLIKTAIEMAINELVELFYKTQEDQTNNSADSIKEQSK